MLVLAGAGFGVVLITKSDAVVAPTALASCRPEASTESAALAMAAECGHTVGVASQRTEFQEVSANPDGTLRATISVEPTRTFRDGAWRPVDMTLRATGNGVAPVAPASASPMSGVEFSDGRDGPMMTLRSGAAEVRMWAPWPLPVPTLDGEKAVYAEVMPHVDLELTVTKAGFSHVLVVKDRAAVNDPSVFERVTFRLSLANAHVATTEAGGLLVTDPDGEPIFVSGSALMWDSSAPEGNRGPGAPPNHRPMPVTVSSGDATEVTIEPDLGMLTDPKTVYPVYIDPTLTTRSMDWWTHVNSCAPTTSYWTAVRTRMYVGKEWGTSCMWRSFLQFDLNPMRGAVIIWAGMDITADHTAACAGSTTHLWRTSTVFAPEGAVWNNTNHWINPPGGGEYVDEEHFSANQAACPKPDDPGSFGDGPMRTLVHRVANDPDTGYKLVLGLRSGIENDQMGWTYFHPNATLTAEYHPNNNPLAPTLVKPTGNCYPSCNTSPTTIRTLTPTVQANVVDPEGRALTVEYELRRDTDWGLVTSKTWNNIASGSTVTWTLPTLTNGATYHYRVHARDPFGAWGPWTSAMFTVNTTGPGTPTGVGVTGDCYESCSSPAMLRSARPTFRATVPHPFGDVLSVRFEVLNASDTVIASTTKTNVPAGTTPTWQPSSDLPQESLRLRVRSTDVYNRDALAPDYHFTVDTQAPAAPTVSSPVYLHKDTGTWNGGIGVPGSFTASPVDATDVVAFEWRINEGTPTTENVPAGESATFTITPTADLELKLEVRAIDHAGWTSDWTPYPFLVRAAPVEAAYWKFDESSGSAVTATNGGPDYDGTRVGGTAWAASEISATNPAASGNAVSLDGTDDYVWIPRVVATNHAAGFSVSAWVKPTALSGDRTVLAGTGANTYAFRLHYKADTEAWCFSVAGQDSADPTTHSACSALPPQVDVWTHLVGVYDPASSLVRLYVNGGPFNGVPSAPGTADQGAAPTSMWPATGHLYVGRSFTGEFWPGLIDEVRVYQRALPEVEARHLFRDCWEEGCPPIPAPTDPADQCRQSSGPPCVGQWRLDEGAGTVAADASQLGNALTLAGGASWTAEGYRGTPAVTLDGASGRLSTVKPVLLTDQSFTISAWVRLDQLLATDQVVMQAGGTDASSFKLLHLAGENRWFFGITSHDGVAATWHVVKSTSPVAAGVWTHLVAMYDGQSNEVRLYVNGELEGVTGGAAGQPTTSGLSIGAYFGGDGYLDGTLDLIGLYQGAMTAAQVTALYQEQVAPPALLAWYEMEEWDSEAYDYSETGNPAALSAEGVEWTTDGRDDSSGIELDGVQGELTTGGPVLNTSDSYTVMGWAKPADTDAEHTLLSQDGTLTSAFQLLSNASGQWCLRVAHADAAAAGSTQVCGGTAEAGVWAHVAGVYDAAAGELRLYVNGTLAASQSYSASTFAASGSFVIGRALTTPSGGTAGPVSYFAGIVDGVRAYQGALTDAQVTTVYSGSEI